MAMPTPSDRDTTGIEVDVEDDWARAALPGRRPTTISYGIHHRSLMNTTDPFYRLLSRARDQLVKSMAIIGDAWLNEDLTDAKEVLLRTSSPAHRREEAKACLRSQLIEAASQALRERIKYEISTDYDLISDRFDLPRIVAWSNGHWSNEVRPSTLPPLGCSAAGLAEWGDLSLLLNARRPMPSGRLYISSSGKSTVCRKSRLIFVPGWETDPPHEYAPRIDSELIQGHEHTSRGRTALHALQHLLWQAKTSGTPTRVGLRTIEEEARHASGDAENDRPDEVLMRLITEVGPVVQHESAKFLASQLDSLLSAHSAQHSELGGFVEVFDGKYSEWAEDE